MWVSQQSVNGLKLWWLVLTLVGEVTVLSTFDDTDDELETVPLVLETVLLTDKEADKVEAMDEIAEPIELANPDDVVGVEATLPVGVEVLLLIDTVATDGLFVVVALVLVTGIRPTGVPFENFLFDCGDPGVAWTDELLAVVGEPCGCGSFFGM